MFSIKNRLFVSVLLIGVLLTSLLNIGFAAPLSDISGHKNQTAIEYLYDNEVIQGYEDGTFRPENTVNRAELLKILVGGAGAAPTLDGYKNCFPDVKEDWYAPYVCYAKDRGWVQGYPDGTFLPAQTVNKVEAIKMVDESQGYVLMKEISSFPYSDVDPAQWYADYVAMAVERDLLEEEGVLGVSNGMTRANISEIIYRAMLLQGDDADAELFAPEGDSSIDLIDEAYEDDDIDFETSLLYKLYAVYDDENLPDKYSSDVPIFEENELFFEILENYDSLSSETQEEIDPFLKRPEDPESYINQRYLDDSVAAYTAHVASNNDSGLISQRPDASLYTEFLLTDNGFAKVWYPNSTLTFKKLKGTGTLTYDSVEFLGIATKIRDMLDNDAIIEQYDDLLDRSYVRDGTLGGDNKLDIYVSPIAALGLATTDSGSLPSSGYFQVNPALEYEGDKYIRATVAHELFHIYQYAFKQNWDKDHWWREATATWAMDFIYPMDNVEQVFLKRFIPYPEVTLNQKEPPKVHVYGAYIFAFFLTNNDTDDLIRETWEGCETKLCLDAIDSVIDGGYKTQWRKFSLWNFNKSPAKYYTDKSGYFSPLTTADTAHEVSIDFSSNGDTMDIDTDDIEPLANQVIKITNNVGFQSDVKKIVFKDFSNYTALSDSAAIHAVIHFVGKDPAVEEWTDRDRRAFCLDTGSDNYEDFSEIYLIFSNGSKDDILMSTNITAEAADTCGGNWVGTLNITGNYTSGYECDYGDHGRDSQSWSLKIEEELAENSMNDIIDNGNINYDILKQKVTYSSNQSSSETQVFSNGDETTTMMSKAGSGTVTRYPDNEYTIETELGDMVLGRNQRFLYFAEASDMIMDYVPEGTVPSDVYQLNLEMLGGNIYGTAYGMCDWVTYNSTYDTTYSNGDTDHDTYFEDESCNESEISYAMEDDLVEQMQDIDPPIENGNRIKGKITLNSSSGAEPDWSSGYCDGATWSNNVIIDWDYSKE